MVFGHNLNLVHKDCTYALLRGGKRCGKDLDISNMMSHIPNMADSIGYLKYTLN